MRRFAQLFAEAARRKGGKAAMEALLPQSKSAAQLRRISDDRYLSDMSRRVFRAGLRHAMVDGKWPAFEKVFYGFNPARVARMSDEELERLMGDESIVRHFGKIKSVRGNAQMMMDIAGRHGSFAKFIAEWPTDNIVGLWQVLKKQGSQLGGQSGARFLRMIGKDTFLLTDDVVKVLVDEGIVSKMPSAQRDLLSVQQAFNQWHDESSRPLCQISRVLSFLPG